MISQLSLGGSFHRSIEINSLLQSGKPNAELTISSTKTWRREITEHTIPILIRGASRDANGIIV